MDNQDWAVAKCRFMTAGKQCDKSLSPRSYFCVSHQTLLAPLSNPEVLAMNARGAVECVEVKEKCLHMKRESVAWDGFLNSWHELLHRGYVADDILHATAQISENEGLFAELEKQLGRDPSWKKLEKVIAAIHHLTNEGAKVILDEKVVGKMSKGERQIDVSVKFKEGLYEYFVMVECKDYNKAVSIDRLEALATKMKDVGANKAIIVSKKGFQKGAKAIADFYEIELFILGEEGQDWTKKVIEEVKQVPFPVSFAFDCPRQPPHHGISAPSFDDFLIRESPESRPITLRDVAVQVSDSACKSRIELPCEMYIQFDEHRKPWQVLFPVYKNYIPIFGITITLEARQWISKKGEIDLPPKKVSYVYSDVKRNIQHRFDVKKVKKVAEDL